MSEFGAMLYAHVAAVAPIVGVSVGQISDRNTWRIDFRPEATEQQRLDGVAALDSFVYVPSDPADMDRLEKALKALGLLMRDYCNQLQAGTYTNKTIVQLKADYKAKFDALP